ncbi:MAG: hypothetical protein Q8M92_03820 [Candidatus Subteraquimicrobiales bacterium]|nr:hypothetical protein [Candidatus Subteraquimicrobiales bacterium]
MAIEITHTAVADGDPLIADTDWNADHQIVNMLGYELVEEKILPRNFFTPNIATGTDTGGNTTGFTAAASTITSSTEQAWEGTKSLKVVTNNAGNNEGVSAAITPVASQQYTASVYVHAPSESTLEIAAVGGGADSVTESFIGDGSFQRVSVTVTAATTASLAIHIRTNGQQSVTYYCDGWQIETGSTSNLWGDTLTFPFTGLDGDADLEYLIEYQLEIVSPGGDYWFTVMPNNLETNQGGTVHAAWTANNAHDTAGTTKLCLNRGAWGEGAKFDGDCKINVKTGRFRRYLAVSSMLSNDTHSGVQNGGGFWRDTTTNITSLIFKTSLGNMFGTMRLWKKIPAT